MFFGILGCLKRWLKHFFGDVGSKMAFFRHLGSTCGTCWRQDGQQDGQDGQHEGQDGRKLRPRWAKIAPSWRSWAQLGRFWEHVGSILGVFWHMGWIAENLQKLNENISFWVFWGAWSGAVIRKSGMGAMLVDLVAPFGVLRTIL